MQDRSERRRGRWGNIAAGYLAAVVVADAIFFVLIGLDWPAPRPNDIGGAMLVGVALAVPITIAMVLPVAAPIIWQAERHQVRSWVFYTAAGGLANVMALGAFIAFTAWKDYHRGVAPGWPPLSIIDYVLMFLPGLCAGFTYWSLAGRKAGSTTRATSASGSISVQGGRQAR